MKCEKSQIVAATVVIIKWSVNFGNKISYLRGIILMGSNIIKSLIDTGKSLSEALIFASTNPQYDNICIVHWITSSIHENSKLKPGKNMLCTEIVSNIQNNFCTQHVLPIKVGIMVTKSKSLFTDDTSQITKSDSEWFFWNRTTSNYFCHLKVSLIISRYLDS